MNFTNPLRTDHDIKAYLTKRFGAGYDPNKTVNLRNFDIDDAPICGYCGESDEDCECQEEE
jgi:hypothetical protein